MTRPARIAVVYASPVLDSTPCLNNLIQELADAGYAIDIYTVLDDHYTSPKFSGEVELICSSGPRSRFIRWLFPLVRSRRNQYGGLIAMDRMGLIALAAAMLGFKYPPLVYFNVELYLPPVFLGWRHGMANRLEAFLARRLGRLILSPARERAEYLANWYRLDRARMLVLPNSPRGQASAEPGDYLRVKYAIEPCRPVVLYFGSLTEANRIEELLRAARDSWPEEWVFVLHGRGRGDEEMRRWLEQQARGANCRIIFSLDPLAIEDLARLVRSADIGIALYPSDGPGFATMGTASGKIAQYLHSGVPVVTSEVESLRHLFRRHPRAGVCVPAASEIPAAVRAFLSDPKGSRSAAAACFEAEFSFDRAYQKFLPRFESLLKGGCGGQ